MKHFTIKHATKALVLGLIVLAVTGCGTASNGVNSGGLIQKRKYTKGFYLNLPQRGQRANETVTVEDVQPADEIAVIKPQQKTGDNSSLRTPLIVKTETTEQAPVAMIPEKIVNEENSVPITRKASQKGFHTAQLLHSAKQPVARKTNSIGEEMRSKMNLQQSSAITSMQIICILLAILLPPLGVLVWTNIDWKKVLIALLLTILFYVPGLIYAILVILDVV